MELRNILHWTFALYVHILLLVSLIDLWPKEWLDEEAAPESPCGWGGGVTDRVVIFFLDGMTARWMFNFTENDRNSFLSVVAYSNGCAGVVTTKEPVSVLTGLTAIMVGAFTHEPLFPDWVAPRSNKIDSLLDRVHEVKFFGSEKVLKTLEKYSTNDKKWLKFTPGKVKEKPLDSLKNRCIRHNDWVTDLVCDYFFVNDTISRGQKSIIFIHLTTVGCDERRLEHFTDNHNCVLKSINKNIEAMYSAIEEREFQKTTFLVTSGYGDDMYSYWLTNAMSHPQFYVSQHLQNPLIAWGFGINRSLLPLKKVSILRIPTLQTSVTPLIGTLLGVGVPSRSTGQLPMDYLQISNESIADAVQCNANHLERNFQFKAKQLANKSSFLYHLSDPLSNPYYTNLMEGLNASISTSNYESVKLYSHKLSALCNREMGFISSYYKDILSFFICGSLIFWTLLLLSYTVIILPEDQVSHTNSRTNRTEEPTGILGSRIEIPRLSTLEIVFHVISFLVFLTSIIVPVAEGWPLRFVLYITLFVILLWALVARAIHFGRGCQESQPRILFYITLIIWIALIFDSFPINYFSLLVFFAVMTNIEYADVPTSELQLWLLTSLAAMPLVVYNDSSSALVVLFTSVMWLAVVFVFFDKKSSLCVFIGAVLVMAVCIRIGITDWNFVNKCSSSFTFLVIGWLSFIPIIFIPLFGSDSFLTRTLEIAILIAAPYLLLNAHLESATMLLIQMNLLAWVYIENHSKYTMKEMTRLSIKEHSRRTLVYDDSYLNTLLRRAFCFIVYIFYMHLASGTPALSTFVDEVPNNLFPCMRSALTVSLGELLRHFFQIIVVSVYLAIMCRISRIPFSLHAHSIMLYCSIFTLMYFLPFLCLDSEAAYNLIVVSRVWIGLLMPILVIVALPIAYYLTAPSLFTIVINIFPFKPRNPRETVVVAEDEQ